MMALFLFLELLRYNFVFPIPSELVMKQFQIIIIAGIIILGVFCYTLLQPGLWKNKISNYLIPESIKYKKISDIAIAKL